MTSVRQAFAACLSVAALCACAPVPTKPDARDPWERMNRATYRFNDTLDRAIAKPVAKAYVKVAPQVVRTGVSNFFNNLDGPLVIVNDALQLKLRPAARDLGRFVLNTTVGIGGILDPASAAGLDSGDEDFGQTFGHWGAGPGPYLVLPILGPSDVRDAIGKIPAQFVDPVYYLPSSDTAWAWGIRVIRLTDERARLLDTDSILMRAYDPYTFMKNAYLQRRLYQVTDGKIDEQPADAGLEAEMKEEDAAEKAEKAEKAATPADKPVGAPQPLATP